MAVQPPDASPLHATEPTFPRQGDAFPAIRAYAAPMRALPVLLVLGLVVFALVDCLQTPSPEVRQVPKPLWLAAIVLVPVLGALGWLLLGRPRSGRRPATPRRRPLAPDDDPDFLRGLRPPPPPARGEDEPGDPQRP